MRTVRWQLKQAAVHQGNFSRSYIAAAPETQQRSAEGQNLEVIMQVRPCEEPRIQRPPLDADSGLQRRRLTVPLSPRAPSTTLRPLIDLHSVQVSLRQSPKSEGPGIGPTWTASRAEQEAPHICPQRGSVDAAPGNTDGRTDATIHALHACAAVKGAWCGCAVAGVVDVCKEMNELSLGGCSQTLPIAASLSEAYRQSQLQHCS